MHPAVRKGTRNTMAATQTLNDENLDTTVQKGGTLFIFFWAKDCEFCAEFAPVFEAVAKKQKNVMFGKVDIDAQEGLADDFDIEGTPTVIIIRDGVVVAREEGAMSAKELEEVVAGIGALDMDVVRSELAVEATKAAAKSAAKKKPVAKKKAVVKKPVAKKKAVAKKPVAKKK
ncbi:MAG: thioredoxin family protein [Archangium sp.]|nr:thioredoxin family protein [Archangium sp.]MDP3152962.1 thioredoxin family protein [Archangium sp.]MDP3569081.1 thioredoxin family protein [Archangium sp.]